MKRLLLLALLCGACTDAPRAQARHSFHSAPMGSLDFNGATVQLHWVAVTNDRGSFESCLGTTLQGGIAEMPFYLCEAANDEK